MPSSVSVTGAEYTWYSYTSAYIHHAILKGLKPSTFYHYSCENTNSYNFTTAPVVGPEVPFVFGLIGDLGQTQYSQQTVQHVQANPSIQGILHVGDLSYADGVPTRWDSWGRLIQVLFSRHLL
jgi:phosphodiesterase/alkaline phosphatase D-like protein